jgi:hypothetical protein
LHAHAAVQEVMRSTATLEALLEQHERQLRNQVPGEQPSEPLNLDERSEVPPLPQAVAMLLGYPFAYHVSKASVLSASAHLCSETLLLCRRAAAMLHLLCLALPVPGPAVYVSGWCACDLANASVLVMTTARQPWMPHRTDSCYLWSQGVTHGSHEIGGCRMCASLTTAALRERPGGTTAGSTHPKKADSSAGDSTEIVLWSCSVPINICDAHGTSVDAHTIFQAWCSTNNDLASVTAGCWHDARFLTETLSDVAVAL